MGNAIYRRRGWQDKVLAIVNQDKSAGLVDLADDEGTTVVTSLPIFKEDPAPEQGLDSWAVPADASATVSKPTVDDEAVALIVTIASSGSVLETCELDSLNKPTLQKIAGALAIAHDSRTSKADLIDLIIQFSLETAETDDDHDAADLDSAEADDSDPDPETDIVDEEIDEPADRD